MQALRHYHSLFNFEAETDFNFDSFSKYVSKNNVEELYVLQNENASDQTLFFTH